MKLNLRQIEVFRAIMMNGSLVGAARALHVSQPAVSRLISHMEQRLGMLLFQRIKGRLQPTPEAQQLFREVGAVYQSVERLNALAENLARGGTGELRLACSPNLGQSLVPRTLAVFCKRHPDVRVELHTLIPHVMMHSMLTRQIEFGIAYIPTTPPGLSARPLHRNRIVAVLPVGHRLASRAVITCDDLASEDLISYSADIPLGHLVEQIFAGESRAPRSRIQVQQAHVACAMVQAGVGVALVDEITLQGPTWDQVCARPFEPACSAIIQVFHNNLEPLSHLAEEFLSIFASLDREDQQSAPPAARIYALRN